MAKTFEHGGVRELAYDLTEGKGPGVVFLGGFRSDKEGTTPGPLPSVRS